MRGSFVSMWEEDEWMVWMGSDNFQKYTKNSNERMTLDMRIRQGCSATDYRRMAENDFDDA